MPAVENSLGPCRKPKSTIYGWTLFAFYEIIKINQPLYLFFFDIQLIISFSSVFPRKRVINPGPFMPWIQAFFDTLIRFEHPSIHGNS
jgi:hypothetical protein